MKKRLIVVGVVALVFAVLLMLAPACGNGEEEPTPTPGYTPTPGVTPTPTPTPTGEVKTLKIGFIGPLSGPAAAWGVGSELGAKWAADRFNAAGGLQVGDDTYMVEIVSCDTKFTGSVGAECATRFAYEEGIEYVVGPIGVCDAVDPIFNQNKVLYVTQATVCPPLVQSPYRVTAVIPSWDWTNAFYDQVVQHHPELKTVTIIAPDNSMGYEFMDATVEIAADHGMTVVSSEYFDTTATDFYPVLTPIVANNPDCIDLGTGAAGPGWVALLTKQVRELGYDGLLLQPAATPNSTLLDIAGSENVRGILSSLPGYSSEVYPDRTRELYQEWLAEYAQPGETDISITTGNSFKSMLFLKAAIEAAGTIDVDEVIKAFEQPDFRFDIFAADNVRLGGVGTFAIKRAFPHPIPYGEIIDANNIHLSMSVQVVDVP